jgi:hypothetical protein
MTFSGPYGYPIYRGPPIHCEGGKIKEKVFKQKLFIGVGFNTKILCMTFLTPRGTKDSPYLLHFHCEGGKIWKQFTNFLGP